MGGQVGGLPPVRTVLRVRVVVLGRRVEGRVVAGDGTASSWR